MMAFDHSRSRCAAFDHVRVDRSLRKDADIPGLRGGVLKDTDEVFTDDPALGRRAVDGA